MDSQRRIVLTLVFFLLSVVTPFAADPVSPPPNIDQLAEKVMHAFQVPGMAVAIVKDGQVVLAKGYGVRKMGEEAKTDAKTLFGIASNTKVFTATALGMLVEEHKLEWDAPVIRYLPSFQMWDPFVTREMTIRDLLVHRSGLGLGAGDLLWWPPSNYNRKEIVRRLRFVKPATSFRSAYAYDNVLYLVAGEVIEAVSGQTWEDFVTQRILRKAGMTDSNVLHSAAGKGGNSATPHAEVEGRVRVIRPFESDNTNPAGGINSCAEDMTKWLLVQLSEGTLPDGSRLFSPQTSRELTAIVTPLRPRGNPPPELQRLKSDFRGYALGLQVEDYRGKKIVSHTGGLPGYVSMVMMVPDLELGVAVLTNQESGEAFIATTYSIIDYYIGGEPFDWVTAYQKVQERERAQLKKAEEKTATDRNPASRPSLPLTEYAGRYRDAWYGDMEILEKDGTLSIRFNPTPSLVGQLEHYQYDTFIARWTDRELRADAFVTFSLDEKGKIDQVKMKAVSPATDFSFDFHDLLFDRIQ